MKATVASACCLAVLLAAVAGAGAADDQPAAVRRPGRMGEGCAGARDIAIFQSSASPLPGGVPAYKVDVVNQCAGDPRECAVGGIHVRCGFFSSVSLVDPRKFRRLRHDDCLVNDGRPMRGGDVVSFEYANSFPYKLPVSAAVCVHP